MRKAFAAAAVVVVAAGCGTAARQAAPARCVVRIYFCSEVACGRAASKSEITTLSRRLGTDDDVYSVSFVDKREALSEMKKRYPDLAARLKGVNPFPDALRVRPVKGVPPERIAAKVHKRKNGVHAVKFSHDRDCGAST
jgi:cell division protein FtsX